MVVFNISMLRFLVHLHYSISTFGLVANVAHLQPTGLYFSCLPQGKVPCTASSVTAKKCHYQLSYKQRSCITIIKERQNPSLLYCKVFALYYSKVRSLPPITVM